VSTQHKEVPSTDLTSAQSSSQRKVKAHISSLDLLRGFAALSVVLFHFSFPGRQGGGVLVKFYSPTLHHMFYWGKLGVEVFFVISGFIIPFSLWDSAYTLADFERYMRKRIIRITPPAYVIILFILVQWAVIDYGLHHTTERINSISFLRVVSNLLFIAPFTDSQWFNGVFWTLAIEFQYYVLLGLLFNMMFKDGQFIVFLVLNCLLFAATYLPGVPHETFLLYSPLFAAGSSALFYYKGRINLQQYLASLALWALLSWLALGWLATLFGVVTACLIVFVHFNNPIFSFFGKISYSLYLTHVLVGSTLEFVLSKIWPSPNNALSIVIIITLTVVSVLFSYLYYLWVELPFLRLAQRLKI
jgi:peptidoglycan/LPS O-acetylase OafA/YrhL